MSDLEIAIDNLRIKSLTLSIVKNGKLIFASRSKGISGLFEAIKELGNELARASFADRIVGRAAALLLVYVKSAEVYGYIMSRQGLKIFRDYKIPLHYFCLVSKILSMDRKTICPLEKVALSAKSPENAYENIVKYLNNLPSFN